MTRKTLLLFLALLSMRTFDSATAKCPAPELEEILPQTKSGTLSRDERGKKQGEWCGWTLRDKSSTGHLILLRLTSLSLSNSKECLGDLRLTGFPSFCRKPLNSCFIYTTNLTCARIVTFDFAKSENCSRLHWDSRKHDSRQIRYRSREIAGRKSFSFDYKFISCKQDLRPAGNSIPSITVSANVTSHDSFMTPANRTAGPVSQIHSGVSTGTLAGVIAFFILLLAATIALLLLLYRRLRKLKLQAHSPARVQYELAKARDITVLQSSNTEQTNDSPSRESTFSLHGEHHSMNSRNDETITREEPVERKYSAIEDLNLGDAATPTFPTLPVQRRQPDPEDETCVYATVNKRRATIER